jgi:hypothetical protein
MNWKQKKRVGIVVSVLACLLVAGAIFGFAAVVWKAWVRSGNAVTAIENLKTIDAVERQYYATHGRKFGTFDELVRERLLDARFSGEAPVVDGYVYQLTISQDTTHGSTYVLTANPLNSSTGRNHLYRDSKSDVIRINSDRRAGPDDPPVIYKP